MDAVQQQQQRQQQQLEQQLGKGKSNLRLTTKRLLKQQRRPPDRLPNGWGVASLSWRHDVHDDDDGRR
ncbi:GH21127 [Drosophila grimshawi]|uniref:GH21127 n=1 Tax=Drosophila grimshawi TaxID=7222 RepID=B4J699_DROGR|nr:GH21127 [Drosophila grimshawi]